MATQKYKPRWAYKPAPETKNKAAMNEEEQRELQEKHKAESRAMMRRLLVMGGIKILILSAISAVFIFWYMH